MAAIDEKYGEGWKETGIGGPSRDFWNNPDVRGALYAMHGRACAYCQQYLPENDRGDVEHFRPQSIYRWLAYAFDNYLLSCSTCNRLHKKDDFPRRGMACAYVDRGRLDQEERLLLDPTTDPTETWVDYDLSDDLCPVIPASALPADALTQVETTIALFKLNTRSRLVGARLDAIDRVEELLRGLDSGEERNAFILKRLASRYSPHAVIVRRILARIRPTLLPTSKEELALLITELCSDLDLMDRTRPSAIDRVRSRTWDRMRREILYALAVIWHAPLGSNPAEVEILLNAAGIREIVLPFRVEIVPLSDA